MNAPIDPQTTWDREDALYRLRRLQHLRVQLADAEQQRENARSVLGRAIAEEKRLRAALYAALEVETTPDLFTPRPKEEPDPLPPASDEAQYPDPAIHADAEKQALPPEAPWSAPEAPEGHPWPEWLSNEVLHDAYLGQAKFKAGKLARLKPLNWDGQLWVATGICWGGNYDEAHLLLLSTPEAFTERWPGIPTRLEPGPLHSDAAPLEAVLQVEDHLQWYTGVRIRVGRREAVIAPAGEGRTVIRKKGAPS